MRDPDVNAIREYWDTHTLGMQYVKDRSLEPGTAARFDAIVGPNGGYADPFEGWSEAEIEAFFEEKTEEEVDAFFREAEQTTNDDIDQDALAALQQEEIDMAVADFECRDNYWEVYQEISGEYEADFVAENREALEKIRESQGG
jgi:hypothetical protein